MRSEFPAGLNRSDIDLILSADPQVIAVERVDGAKAMWRIVFAPDDQSPVEIVIDNGVNEIYVQSLIQIDTDHIFEALTVVGPIAVVGLAVMGETLFMRSVFFIGHSTMHALTNSYSALALAYGRYQQAILT